MHVHGHSQLIVMLHVLTVNSYIYTELEAFRSFNTGVKVITFTLVYNEDEKHSYTINLV